MKIITNISKEQMDFIREQSIPRCPSRLEFIILINDKQYKAKLEVETITLNEGFRNIKGKPVEPIYKRFNKIEVYDIEYEKDIMNEIADTLRIDIDGTDYYGCINNNFELKNDKFYSTVRFIER